MGGDDLCRSDVGLGTRIVDHGLVLAGALDFHVPGDAAVGAGPAYLIQSALIASFPSSYEPAPNVFGMYGFAPAARSTSAHSTFEVSAAK